MAQTTPNTQQEGDCKTNITCRQKKKIAFLPPRVEDVLSVQTFCGELVDLDSRTSLHTHGVDTPGHINCSIRVM